LVDGRLGKLYRTADNFLSGTKVFFLRFCDRFKTIHSFRSYYQDIYGRIDLNTVGRSDFTLIMLLGVTF